MIEELKESPNIQPLKENEVSFEEADIPLSEEETKRYTGMVSKSLDITADEIKTVGELEGASDYISGILRDRFIEDKLDISEYMISKGWMSVPEAQRLLKSPWIKNERPLEAYLALHGYDRTMVDDDTQGAALQTEPVKRQEMFNVSANVALVESMASSARNKGVSWYHPKRLLTLGFTAVENIRRAKASPSESKFLPNIRRDEQYLIRQKINSLSPNEFEKWLSKYAEDYISRGGDYDILADSLEDALKIDRTHAWDYAGLGLDIGLPLGLAVKSGAQGFKAGAKTATRQAVKATVGKGLSKEARAALVNQAAVRGAIGGAIKGSTIRFAAEAIPFADVAAQKAFKVVTNVKNSVTNELKYYKNFRNRKAADATLASIIEKNTAAFEDPLMSETIVKENVDGAISPRVAMEDTAGISRMVLTEDANRYSQALSRAVSQLDESGMNLVNLEEEALNAALDSRLRKWYEDNPDMSANLAEVVDVDFLDMADGHLNARFIVGTGEGLRSPFISREAAEDLAKSLKKSKGITYTTVVNDGAGYWVYADLNMENSRGVIVESFLRPEDGYQGAFKGGLLGYVTQRTSIPESFMRFNNFTMKAQNDLQNLFKNARASYDGLHKAEKADFEFLVEQSRIKEAFLTETAMREAGYTEATINAYQNARMVHDIAWIAKQRALTKFMKDRGLKRITVYPDKKAAEGIVTGRIIKPDSFNEDRYFIIEETGTDRTPFKMTRSQFNNTYAKDYEIIEYLYKTDGIPANHAYHLVPKKTMRVHDLDENFSSYIAGFSHIYDDNAVYIKQLKTAKLPDGEEVIDDIYTLFGETNVKLARRYADELENIRKAVADFETGGIRFSTRAELDRFIASNSPTGKWASSADFKAFAEKNNISLNPKDVIEAVKQGDVLKASKLYKIDDDALKSLNSSDSFGFVLKKMNGLNEGKISRAARKTTYERPLTGIGGDRTPFIDARTEIQHWIRNIENVTTMDNYTKLYADAYANMFKDVIAPNQTPMQALRTGNLVGRTESNAHRINAAIKAKRTHDYMRGVMTNADVTVANFITRVLDDFGERFPVLQDLPLVGNAFVSGTNLQRSIATLSPVKYARWFVSHTFLGFLNPRQLFTQSLAIHQTIAISPAAGTKAVPFSLIMGGLLQKRSKEAIKVAQKALLNAGVEDVTTSWLSNFIEAASKLDVYGRTAQGGAIDVTQQALSTRFDKYSLALFYTGESINRYHSAATTLFEELAKGAKIEDLAKMNKQTQARLLTRQNDLYMNMNKTGVAPIQQGTLLSLAMQMKGFTMRYIESFFNKNLTASEKLRLALSDLILTGFKGWTGCSIYNWASEKVSMTEEQQEMFKAFEEGLINTAVSKVFDRRIDIAEVMSPRFLSAITESFDMNTGTIPFSSVFKKSGKGYDIVYNHFQTWKNGPLTAEGFTSLTKQLAVQRALPTGAQNAVLGWMIADTGNKYASSGQLIASDLDTVDAVATALGFKLMDEEEIYRLNSIKYSKRERVNEAFKFLQPFFNEMIRSSTIDSRKRFKETMALTYERFGIESLQEKKDVFNRLMSQGKTANKEEKTNLIIDIAKDSGIDSAKELQRYYGR